MKIILATLFVLSSTLSFAQSKINDIFCLYGINNDSSESVVTKKRTATINDFLSDTELWVCSDFRTAQLNMKIVSFTLKISNKSLKTIEVFKETIGNKLTEEQLSFIRKLGLGNEIYIDEIKVSIDGTIGEKLYCIKISLI